MVDRARQLAEGKLARQPKRLAHVRGVVGAVECTASILVASEYGVLCAAAWLHDVGYAPSIRRSGFHPVDGAEFVREAGFPDVVISLVAYHTGAAIEAAERGLSDRLAGIAAPPDDLLDVLTYADMTTGPDGELIGADERVAETLCRYAADDPVHRAVERSARELLAAVGRVTVRLTAP